VSEPPVVRLTVADGVARISWPADQTVASRRTPTSWCRRWPRSGSAGADEFCGAGPPRLAQDY